MRHGQGGVFHGSRVAHLFKENQACYAEWQVVVLENAHYLDSASWSLVRALGQSFCSGILILALRPTNLNKMPVEFQSLRAGHPGQIAEVALRPLSAAGVDYVIHSHPPHPVCSWHIPSHPYDTHASVLSPSYPITSFPSHTGTCPAASHCILPHGVGRALWLPSLVGLIIRHPTQLRIPHTLLGF